MNLISKKELLIETGISYGQLYRWKRERLIPEEWFNKQSSFTGQETYFPRDQILGRVQTILAMKDTHSLEELAAFLSPKTETTITSDTLRTLEGFDRTPLRDLPEILGKTDFSLQEIGFAYGLSMSSGNNEIPSAVWADLIRASTPVLSGRPTGGLRCSIFEFDGNFHTCFTNGTEEPFFDLGVRMHYSFALEDSVNILKTRLCGKKE